ncbi:MAG: MFS transporter, partial [Actinobacteria bacterium]|nr:MFS transporter [Actinomycetota bacterium]
MNASHHRWRVLLGLIGVYSAFGMAVTALAPMLTLVQEDIGASRGSMGLALGAWAFIFIFTAPLAGRFIDRFGIGWAVSLGGCSVAGSLLARANATSVSSMWLAVALFGVFGPLISASAPTFVARWFPDEAERRRAVGLYVIAPAVGGVAIVATTNSFLLPWFDDSWRTVL